MVAVETREQSSTPDKRVATPHQYRVENLHPNDPLLLALPYLYIDNRLLCLVIRLKGGVSGIARSTLIEEMKRAAETDGSLVVNPFQDILKDTREKFRRNGFPITIENLSPPSKPALYRFSDAERWVSPQEDAPRSASVKEVVSPAQPTEIITASLAVVVPAPSSEQQVFPALSDEQLTMAKEPRSEPDIPVREPEMQVLELALQGLSETQIATRLEMSRSGVHARIERFAIRLGIKSRKELIDFARENIHRMVIVESSQRRPARQKPPTHQRPRLFPRSKPSSLAREPRRGLPAIPAKTAGTYAIPPRPVRAVKLPLMPGHWRVPDAVVAEPEQKHTFNPRNPIIVKLATYLVQKKVSNTMRLVSSDPQVALREVVPESVAFLEKFSRDKTKTEVDAVIVSCVVRAIAWALNSLSNKGQTPEENHLLVHAVSLRSYGIEPIAIDLYWHFFNRPLPENYLIGTSTNTIHVHGT